MNPPNTHHASAAPTRTFVDLAADGVGTKPIMIVVGVFVVLLLIGGFWYGTRLRSRMGPAPKPSEQPKRPDHQAHIEEDTTSSDRFPGHGERLYPHQLGGHGEEAYQPPTEEERRRERTTGNEPQDDDTPPRA